jgi:2-polyprenyl-3-methyl-5-hydroxy-6-metoxy-1,4-benzoquinol methylase
LVVDALGAVRDLRESGAVTALPPVRDCPLGCGKPGRALGELEKTVSFALSRDRYTLAQCGCGDLVYLSPPPNGADLRAMYVENIQFEGFADAGEVRIGDTLGYVGQCFDRLVAARMRVPGRPIRVLEIGAGPSWMCRVAKMRDPGHVTVAQDISPEAVKTTPWVDHYVQEEASSRQFDALGPFEIISLTHVIEHLVDPLEMIRRCRELLAHDGLLFITAPHRPGAWRGDNFDAWTAYRYNHTPAHIQYFSQRSMGSMAARAGCELEYWTHHHEGGEAFEAWLAPRPPWWRKLLGKR